MPKAIKVSNKEEEIDETKDVELDEENLDETEPEEVLEAAQTPIFSGVAPTIEPPQIINGVVVPRTPVTGYAHAHHMTGYAGAHTSQQVTKPTTHVRFSHPGLKAVVTREFATPKIALEFVKNPNNATLHPVFVDPDSVHEEELQHRVGEKRREQSRLKRKFGVIDAPVGSPDDTGNFGE